MLSNDRWVCTKKWQVEARVLLVQTTADTEGTAGKTRVGVFITVMLLTVCVLIKYRSKCIITKSCFALPLWLFDIFLRFPARWTGLTVGRVWAVWQSSVTHTAALGISSYIMLTCDDRQGFWRKSLTTEISENHTLLFDLRFPTPNTFNQPLNFLDIISKKFFLVCDKTRKQLVHTASRNPQKKTK